MIGVLNVYKEKGYTSFHAVAFLRAVTGEKKIGHTGTLDPDASGVLPVCFGRATKLMGQLEDTDKTYRAVMLLGKKTTTQDISGEVLEEMDADRVRALVNDERLAGAFAGMTGEIEQIPPMYSAVKVGGVKLVNAARRGREIERRPRKATVYEYRDIAYNAEDGTVSFTLDCSKGTYVRTICEDIGQLLGVPSCLKELERTKAAGLDVADSLTLSRVSELYKEGRLGEYIIPVDSYFRKYPAVTVTDDAVRRLVFGNIMFPDDITTTVDKEGIYRVYDRAGEFYALYRYIAADNYCKCEKMFK